MTDLQTLLTVQGLDTSIEQIRHRLATIPARTTLTEREAALAAVDVAEAPVSARRDELARSQKRVEDEIATIEAKVAEEDRRLYSGTVTAARELQDLQAEVEGLRRRQSDLETEVLEIMDLTEPVDAQLEAFDGERRGLRAEIAALRDELTEAEAGLRAELAGVEAERAEVAAGVPPEVVARYEKLRTQLQGTAVARLTGTTCGACHLGLSAVDLDRMRRLPEGEVPTCPECGALLVI